MNLKSNLSKSLLVLLTFLLFYLISRVPLVPYDGYMRSVVGATSTFVFPEYNIISRLFREILSLIFPAITIGLIAGWRNILDAWGLAKDFFKGWLIGIIFTIPMFVGNLIFGSVDFSWDIFFLKAIFPGLFEELIYRGFLFGLLFRYCGWGFVWAAIPAAVAFTIGHFYQAHDFVSAVLVFTVTALGSILFSWLYTEWDYNLWVPISFHAMMDLAWSGIPIDGANTSVGNLTANIGRAIAIILAIVLTILYKRRQGKRIFDYKIV
ncbi:MAG: CPBP family intramembrane metalloprotease [Bacteroidales bacterium]|nr:CPBP family intramembrane metalloprotease [Bacteroidales bacterium]